VPYVDDPKLNRSLSSRELVVDTDMLDKSIDVLSTAIRFRQHDAFAYLLRGLSRSFKAAAVYAKTQTLNSEVRKGLDEGIDDFDKSTFHNPYFSPAYFCGGLVRFWLNQIERDDGHLPPDISRTRQASYRVEHFIDKELERIIGEPSADPSTRQPFYFDPKELDELQDNPAEFLLTLEQELGFPPITQLLWGVDARVYPSKKYIDMVAGHYSLI